MANDCSVEVGCWIHLRQKLAQPSEETLLYSETNTFRGTHNFLTREISTTEQNYWGISTNKNALSSVESRLLGDETRWVLLSKAPVLLYYFFVWNTSPGQRVLHVIMYILKRKIARRDRLHILASNRCETFENLLHIDIAPLRNTLSGILHSKNWTMILSVSGAHDSVSINIHSFFVPDQDTARYSICSAQEKSVSLTEPYTTHS